MPGIWQCVHSVGVAKKRANIYTNAELSRQKCEIRDLLKFKSRLALDKVNDFNGLKSSKILMLCYLFKGYTLSMLISFIREI